MNFYMTFHVIACKGLELFFCNKNYRICYSLFFLILLSFSFSFLKANLVSSIWNFLILLWEFA